MKKFFLLAVAVGAFLTSCNDDDAVSNSTLAVSFNNLPNLGDDFVYEGWLITDSGAESAGRFSVDDNGTLSQSSFTLPEGLTAQASSYVLTIEPANETGAELAAPADTHIVSGDFSGTTANVTVGDSKALGSDFTSSAGGYILATPTTAATDDEFSGVWFLDNSSGAPAAGLSLPTLPPGWKYEGWGVAGGTPYTTGTFTSVTGADEASPFSNGGPPFPGEDFITGRPTFPLNLQGGTIVVSIEPFPDNSPMPFAFKPLVGNVAADALDHTFYTMDQNLSNFTTGTITR